MLVMYSRFHNHVVEKLAAINEGGRFSLNRRLSPADAEKQRDEDLFQTGRLVTCGSYPRVIHDGGDVFFAFYLCVNLGLYISISLHE